MILDIQYEESGYPKSLKLEADTFNISRCDCPYPSDKFRHPFTPMKVQGSYKMYTRLEDTEEERGSGFYQKFEYFCTEFKGEYYIFNRAYLTNRHGKTIATYQEYTKQ